MIEVIICHIVSLFSSVAEAHPFHVISPLKAVSYLRMRNAQVVGNLHTHLRGRAFPFGSRDMHKQRARMTWGEWGRRQIPDKDHIHDSISTRCRETRTGTRVIMTYFR